MIEVESKNPWVIGDFSFQPIFEINDKQGVEHKEVECKKIKMTIHKDSYVLDFNALFMLIYFCANEELRQQLALKYERKVNYIPYDVTFTIDESERTKGVVKRRVQLPVDEISMAVARNEGWKLFLKNKYGEMNFPRLWNNLMNRKGVK